jgi:Activator of Hsp90 ATPase homolog 1-like protein
VRGFDDLELSFDHQRTAIAQGIGDAVPAADAEIDLGSRARHGSRTPPRAKLIGLGPGVEAKGWPEGLYSIARFELQAEGRGTKLVFDHDGFPADMKDVLAQGWQANYWDKLANAS